MFYLRLGHLTVTKEKRINVLTVTALYLFHLQGGYDLRNEEIGYKDESESINYG